MSDEQRHLALYNKMKSEQDNYRDWLLSQPPEEILNHAHEYSVREDILCVMNSTPLPPLVTRALLHAEQPLASVYTNWSKCDHGISNDLVEVVQNWADRELKQSPMFMEICIYQIDPDRDRDRVAYLSSDKLSRYQGSDRINSSLYNSVFRGVVECSTLEDVYHMMNFQHPADYTGRSMSTSDVVQVIHSVIVDPGFYYCESIGFSRIDFSPERTQDMTRAIPVLLLEPGQIAKPTLVNNTPAAMRQLIGGNFEAISLPDGGILLCNEDREFIAHRQNRVIKDDAGEVLDVLVGTGLICGCKDGEFVGLTIDQMKRYKNTFQYPQKILRRNGKVIAKDIKPGDMER